MKTNHIKNAWVLGGLLTAIAWTAAPGHALAACGDGILEVLETCDDGNTSNFDGCSALCLVELGYSCTTQPPIALVNPSFESTITASSAGWVLLRGNIDQVDNSSGCFPPGDMNLSVDLNGFTQGEIAQDITTVPGQRYVLTMLGSANCIEVGGQLCSRTCQKVLTVSARDGATTTPFTTSTYNLFGNPVASTGWQPVRFEFVAASTSTRIVLTGSDPSAAGPMVDRAAIPSSVCTPQTCGNGVVGGTETCDDGNNTSGDGCSSLCQAEVGYTCATPGSACTATCGDGVKVSLEACDDGGTTSGDGCSSTCTIEFGYTCTVDLFQLISICTSLCGDGLKAVAEGCDDGNVIGGDGCSMGCSIESGYACTGNAPSACTVVCGDGTVTAPETCDDGNVANGDGCSSTCTVDPGYTCTGAPSSCVLADCGDGVLAVGETCDDGNRTAGDGCSASCTVEAGYGCGTQPSIPLVNASFESPITASSAGWVLATGNIDQVDNSSGCYPPADLSLSVDLNGTTRGEIYQDIPTAIGQRYTFSMLGSANCITVSGLACSTTCTRILTVSAADPAMAFAPFATSTYTVSGNPSVNGWVPILFEFVATGTTTRLRLSGSDPNAAGPMVDRAAIATSICVPSTCGDGNLDAGEICDDGNNTSGDGCSATCSVVEVGYTCSTPGVACAATCGDGVKVAIELCDDGNLAAGDGCSPTCTLEPGFVCMTDPLDNRSICMSTCGNGVTEAPEACDDGNVAAGDGCSFTCVIENGYVCTPDPITMASICTLVPVDAGVDSGVDSGMGMDSGMGGDGSVIPPVVGGAAGGGCDCSVESKRGEGHWFVTSALFGLALVLRRRRRR